MQAQESKSQTSHHIAPQGRYTSAALEYPEFNPRIILNQLMKNRESYDARKLPLQKWDLRNIGDDLGISKTSKIETIFTNNESLMEDIKFLSSVFLYYKEKKYQCGVSQILDMLKEKYNIQEDDRRSGISLGPRVITLRRIAGVLPAEAVKRFHDKLAIEIVAYDTFPGTKKPETHALCCPLLTSMIPTTLSCSTGNNFHPITIWVSIRFDDIINSKAGNYTMLQDLMSYYRASFKSPAVPEAGRIRIFEKYIKLVNPRKADDKNSEIHLTDDARALAANCLAALEQMRAQDPFHTQMINIAKSGNFESF